MSISNFGAFLLHQTSRWNDNITHLHWGRWDPETHFWQVSSYHDSTPHLCNLHLIEFANESNSHYTTCIHFLRLYRKKNVWLLVWQQTDHFSGKFFSLSRALHLPWGMNSSVRVVTPALTHSWEWEFSRLIVCQATEEFFTLTNAIPMDVSTKTWVDFHFFQLTIWKETLNLTLY